MRKLLALASLAVVVLACDNSHAANRRTQNNTVPYNSAPGGGYVVNNEAARPAGPFARLMEIERRKNAALRQMVFGR